MTVRSMLRTTLNAKGQAVQVSVLSQILRATTRSTTTSRISLGGTREGPWPLGRAGGLSLASPLVGLELGPE